jgi:hypothetical protein
MKFRSLSALMLLAAFFCSTAHGDDRIDLQSDSTILSVLQASAGKTVELRLSAGEKIGGRVERVTDNLVYLSHLNGADFSEAFIDVQDVTAVLMRSGTR